MSSPATRYCYHCQRHHPSEEMRQITSKGNTRWRCIASIQATKRDRAARDAFGKTISAINREDAKVRLTTRLQAERAEMATGK